MRGFRVVEVGTEREIGTAVYEGAGQWRTSGPTVARMVSAMVDTHGLSAGEVLDLYESWSNGRVYTTALDGEPDPMQRSAGGDHWRLQPRDEGGEGGGRWVKTGAGPVSAVVDKLKDMLGDGDSQAMYFSDDDAERSVYMDWSSAADDGRGIVLEAQDEDEDAISVEIPAGHLDSMVAEMSKDFVRRRDDDPMLDILLAREDSAINLGDDNDSDDGYIDWSTKLSDGGRGVEINDGESTVAFHLTAEQWRKFFAGLALSSLGHRVDAPRRE